VFNDPDREREIRTVREPISADNQVQVRMPPDLRRAIEDFRRNEPDTPTRPEAIRRLLKQAVTARQDAPSNLNQQGP